MGKVLSKAVTRGGPPFRRSLFAFQSVAIHAFGLLKVISPSTFCKLFGAPCDSTLSTLTRLSGFLHLIIFGPLTRSLVASNSISDDKVARKMVVLALSSFGFAASLFIHAPKPISDEMRQGVTLDALMGILNGLAYASFLQSKIKEDRAQKPRQPAAIHRPLMIVPALLGAALILRPTDTVNLLFRSSKIANRQEFRAMAASYLGVQSIAAASLSI